MTEKRQQYPREFKIEVVREIERGATQAAVARKYDLHPTLVSRWKREYHRDPEHAFGGQRPLDDDKATIAALEKQIEQLSAENAVLRTTEKELEQLLEELHGEKSEG